jgi:hypothetical protein
MGWTAPRTWTDTEVVTFTMLNQQLRDDQLVLKTSRDNVGRIAALSAATLADLSAANLTGLARLTGSAFTAGRHRFQGDARIVVPVGADKYEDLGGGLRRGNWVEGDYLHHIAQDQTTERRYLGEFVSTPAGAVPGSLWVEGDYLHYVDADGDERRCQSLNAAGAHSDTGAIAGSLWVETYTHWIREAGQVEKPGHADVAHSDAVPHGDAAHSDVPHVDVPHEDVGHQDVAHQDVGHTDTSHGDHTDHVDHADGVHVDSTAHGDVAHQDVSHADVIHSDVPHEDTGHTDTHTDVAHNDHDDHSDVAHTDQPTVVP